MIDFTDCQQDIHRVYGGANGSKIRIEYNGHQYLLKFPPRSHPKYQHGGYANSCISEHLGCKIFRSMGIEAQDTLLGTYRLDDGREKMVVACRDFTENGDRFSPFLDVKNACLSSEEGGAGTELDSIMIALKEQMWIEPEDLRRFYWNMFVVDALIGNFDRHNGNWGFLVDRCHVARIAPVFDCGSSLYPQLPVDQYRRVLDDRREIDLRLYVRPESCIHRNGKRLGYLDFMSSDEVNDCSEAVRRMVPRVDIDRIADIIEGCEELSDIQREFYLTMVTERKEKILDMALEKLESLD